MLIFLSPSLEVGSRLYPAAQDFAELAKKSAMEFRPRGRNKKQEGIVGFFFGSRGVQGEGNWGTLRIPREDWGTLGNIREDWGNHTHTQKKKETNDWNLKPSLSHDYPRMEVWSFI